MTGGYVYRGSNYPWLDGVYFFADYCSGIVWSLERNPATALGAGAAGAWSMTQQTQADFRISSFGEDEDGELYLTGHGDGTVYRLTSNTP